MRRLSRRLPERTRLKSITSLLVGIGLVTAAAASHAASLLEPGTTTYMNQLTSDTTLEVGPAHTLVLDTDDFIFALEAPLINRGVVRWLNANHDVDGNWNALAFASKSVANQGSMILDSHVELNVTQELNNQGGMLQIGVNSSITAPSIVGGRIHGYAMTSSVSGEIKNVTITGQVNASGTVGGALTIEGTMGIGSMSLSESTLLKGGGQSILDRGKLKAAPGANAPQLTIAAGHTLSGIGSISNVEVLNQGTLESQQGGTLRIDSSIVQQDAGAQIRVKGELQTPMLQIQQGSVAIDYTGLVTGDVVVQQGRLVLHDFVGFDDDHGKIGAGISGNLTLSEQSQVEVMVDRGFDYFSALEVWGAASLDGELVLSFLNGVKVPNTFYLYIVGNSLQGNFRSLRVNGTGALPWTFIQERTSENQLTVTITAVPEPGTWGLMLCGLGVVAWRLRRRAALEPTH